MITHNPLHRSQRAELPHWAPTSGSDVPTEIGIRMHDARQWKPFVLQTGHTFTCQPMPLTPSPEGTIPQSAYLIAKRIKFTSVAWHPIVSIVSKQHDPQPLTHCRDGILQATPEFPFDLLQLCPHPFPKGLPKHDKLPLSRHIAHMIESKEVKGLGLAVTTPLPVLGCKPPELDQPRLVVLQSQVELTEAFPKLSLKLFGIRSVLKSYHEVSNAEEPPLCVLSGVSPIYPLLFSSRSGS